MHSLPAPTSHSIRTDRSVSAGRISAVFESSDAITLSLTWSRKIMINYRKVFQIVLSVLFLLAAAVCPMPAQEKSLVSGGRQVATSLDTQVRVTLDYLLYLPRDYQEKDSWPLVLFLHGAGERGDNLDLVKVHGPPKLVETGKDFPFILVSPQGEPKRWWQAIQLTALLDEIVAKHKVDEDRIYVTGLSMGGFGTWSLAAYTPNRFAAIAPICGGGQPYQTKQYPHLAVWAFHGGKDGLIPPRCSQEMVDALNKQGGNAKITIYPEAGHNSWTEAYNNPELYTWLLEQKRAAK